MSTEASLKRQIIQKAWEDSTFKEKLLQNPKAAIQEAFNVILPDSVKLVTVEESASHMYLVLPPSPAEVPTVSKTDVQPQGMWA